MYCAIRQLLGLTAEKKARLDREVMKSMSLGGPMSYSLLSLIHIFLFCFRYYSRSGIISCFSAHAIIVTGNLSFCSFLFVLLLV